MSKRSRSADDFADPDALDGNSPSAEPGSAPAEGAVETKAERFVRLANRRVNNALKHVKYVGNLANRSSYSYTKEQAELITTALFTAVSDVADRFADVRVSQAFDIMMERRHAS